MKDIITKFNKISIEFLEQTSTIIGTGYLRKFKLMTHVNCTYAIDKFIENVLPFSTKILEKDESFFAEKEVDEEYMEYIDEIIGIKKLFPTLDTDSKENIWSILHALIYLAEHRKNVLNEKKLQKNSK
jgi:hypothetical protein